MEKPFVTPSAPLYAPAPTKSTSTSSMFNAVAARRNFAVPQSAASADTFSAPVYDASASETAPCSIDAAPNNNVMPGRRLW